MRALLPYKEYIVPLFWFGVLAYALFSMYFHRHRFARQSFIAFFFIGLLFFSTIAPVALLPFVNWHKFSTARPEEVTRTQIRLVDENGMEIRYPYSAVNIQMGTLARRIARDDFSEKKNEAIARYLIVEAEEYRKRSDDTSLLSFLKFPDHGYHTDIIWSEEVNEYGEFVAIRIYRVTIVTSPDGTERIRTEDELVVEIVPETVHSEQFLRHLLPRKGRMASMDLT